MYDSEEELRASDWSDKRSEMVPVDSCSLPFLGGKYLKTQEAETPHDSRNCFFCRYCGRGFMSNKAMAGHLRIHSHHHPTSKTELQQQQQDDDDDNFFGCLVCTESFSSMKLLCQHTNIHRHMDSSQESNVSSSGAVTIVKQGNGPHTIDLLKDFNFKWSRTGKRGSNRIPSQDAQPLKLRVRPPHMETRKNKKMKTEDTSMEFELGGTKSESGVDPCHARRSRKNKAVKSEHQCEICGKTFETGQALGGHKSYHRVKKNKVELLQQGKTKQEPACMMTPMLLPHLSQQPDLRHPKTMLDFDLNIPYQQ